MTDNLSKLRQKIDQIDEQLLSLMKDRVVLMEKIGTIKKQNNISIRDSAREKEKIELMKQKAVEYNLPPQLITVLWSQFFLLSEEIEK